jgi:hypothetical protein
VRSRFAFFDPVFTLSAGLPNCFHCRHFHAPFLLCIFYLLQHSSELQCISSESALTRPFLRRLKYVAICHVFVVSSRYRSFFSLHLLAAAFDDGVPFLVDVFSFCPLSSLSLPALCDRFFGHLACLRSLPSDFRSAPPFSEPCLLSLMSGARGIGQRHRRTRERLERVRKVWHAYMCPSHVSV